MPKSPFVTFEVCFVAGPTGDQHIFEVSIQRDGSKERNARSMCGKTAADIHKDPKGFVDVTESKERNPNRSLCEKCQEKYKKHPRSPWKAWQSSVKAG